MRSRDVLEWVVLAASAVAIAALAGVLLVDGLAGRHEPPDPGVQLHVDEGRQATHGWLVPATVTNHGDDAAEDVVIEVTATVAGAEQISQLTVAFLPARSAVDVQFGFSATPEGNLAVRVVGYQLP